MSRTLARKVIGMGSVYIGKQRCRVASRPVMAGDRLTATWHPKVLTPRRFDLDVVHSDDHIVVVSKPSGQLVAGTELGDAGSLQLDLERNFGTGTRIMHRLDMDASGLLVAARTKRASRMLTPQFRDHTIARRYLVVTEGTPPEGPCSLRLRKEGRRVVLAGEREGMEAETSFRVLHVDGLRALVEATLKTGRTHQIRVHLQGQGAPIVGDRLYGGVPGDRLCLHAAHLCFNHPVGDRRVSFSMAPPDDFFQAANLEAACLRTQEVPWLSTK
jgi:23S rRNA pseudouridine1911/1915/1917 synthase